MELRAYLAEHNISAPAFAETVSVTAAALYRYISGDRVPRRAVMDRIVQQTCGKVQPNDFFRAPHSSERASSPSEPRAA